MTHAPEFRHAATRAELEVMGCTRARLGAVLREGVLVSVGPGYYMHADAVGPFPENTHLALAKAVVAGMASSTALAGVTAAINHGLPVVGADLSRVQLARPGGTASGTQRSSVSVLRRNVAEEELVYRAGTLTTSVARTVVDLACGAAERTAVIVGDAALRRQLCTREDLAATLAALGPVHGRRRARVVLDVLDRRAESPLESWSRLVLDRSGLPRPDLQRVILAPGGRRVARVDFFWEEFGLVGECDGMGKYFGEYSEKSAREVLDEEKFRAQDLVDLGFVVVRWNWGELVHRPDVVIARIERAINRMQRLRRGA
ncbi:endonuclease domain-containing protein [Williamsia deligens]|uniref:Endonuclease domain-containing protein n=1 Tax=Williamsia deligens TaxID=321325 RepID=A0ABW3G386_9NOCA|nr:endonuclease domain-containing protein [Williamsia deligens]MCP2194552.1 Transcriptional regulator, AbiEi antitoxin, Type IV TA system [Williamsia deligens]